MLLAWTSLARAPYQGGPQWICYDAAAGMVEPPLQCGTFPDTQEDNDYHDPSEEVFDDSSSRSMYRLVEEEDEATREVDKLVSTGHLTLSNTTDDCMKEPGGPTLVVSKFGILVKVEDRKRKRRLILDSDDPGVADVAWHNPRIMLMDVIDLVSDVLKCMGSALSLEVDIVALDTLVAAVRSTNIIPLPKLARTNGQNSSSRHHDRTERLEDGMAGANR